MTYLYISLFVFICWIVVRIFKPHNGHFSNLSVGHILQLLIMSLLWPLALLSFIFILSGGDITELHSRR